MSKSIHQRMAEKEVAEKNQARRRRSFIQNVGYTLMGVSLFSCGATLIFSAAEAIEDKETRRTVTTGVVFFGIFLFGLLWNWIWQSDNTEPPTPDPSEDSVAVKESEGGKSRRRSRRAAD
ncbi:hypothetical protein BSKO_11233 [Bryopsis sp. KO-2023]|nr:hypothetical protein BSKO_11233 [Bryopsis sp. KO-2023]